MKEHLARTNEWIQQRFSRVGYAHFDKILFQKLDAKTEGKCAAGTAPYSA